MLYRMPKFDYLAPKTLEEALSLLSEYGGKAKVLAGGTDLLVTMKERKVTPAYLIGLANLTDLDYIRQENGDLRIGALATHQSITDSNLVKGSYGLLATACGKVGTPQVRNMGTIGGNLCTASPAADTVPSLIGLGAKAKIRSLKGERVVAVEEFFVAPGESVIQTGEILTEIQIPNPPPHTLGVYLKLLPRTAIDMAAVGVAVVVTLDSKHTSFVDAKIVLGAVAPTPIRAHQAEDIIRGKAISDELIEKAAQAAANEAKPISDVRASADYRKKMVRVLTNRALKQAIASA